MVQPLGIGFFGFDMRDVSIRSNYWVIDLLDAIFERMAISFCIGFFGHRT